MTKGRKRMKRRRHFWTLCRINAALCLNWSILRTLKVRMGSKMSSGHRSLTWDVGARQRLSIQFFMQRKRALTRDLLAGSKFFQRLWERGRRRKKYTPSARPSIPSWGGATPYFWKGRYVVCTFRPANTSLPSRTCIFWLKWYIWKFSRDALY